MNFWTRDAWKWPGSRVSRRKRAESAALPCCTTCCADAEPARVMARSAAKAERARRRARIVRCMLAVGGLGLSEPGRAVGRALGARKHRVRLGVVHEAFRLRVPGE